MMARQYPLDPLSLVVGGAVVLAAPPIATGAGLLYHMLDVPLLHTLALAGAAVLGVGAACCAFSRPRRHGVPIRGFNTLLSRAHTFWPHLRSLHAAPDIEDIWECFPPLQRGVRERKDIIAMLASRLGRQWTCIEDEMPHRQALLVLFALASARSSEYNRLRDDLAEAARQSLAGSAGLDPQNPFATVLQRHHETCNHGKVVDCISAKAGLHSYSSGVLMRMLASGRRNRVLPETDFGWLAGVDLPLAMALNAVGRSSYLPQSLAQACHYNEELMAGCALHQPHVEAGADGLLLMLQGSLPPDSTPVADFE